MSKLYETRLGRERVVVRIVSFDAPAQRGDRGPRAMVEMVDFTGASCGEPFSRQRRELKPLSESEGLRKAWAVGRAVLPQDRCACPGPKIQPGSVLCQLCLGNVSDSFWNARSVVAAADEIIRACTERPGSSESDAPR